MNAIDCSFERPGVTRTQAPGKFAQNPAYVEYERLLIALHFAITQHGNESSQADAIRAQMDDERHLWTKLDPQETERINGLSADLDMLSGDEMLDPDTVIGDTAVYELGAALGEKRYDDALRLLRASGWTKQDLMQRVIVRAHCYQALGNEAASVLFQRYGEVVSGVERFMWLPWVTSITFDGDTEVVDNMIVPVAGAYVVCSNPELPGCVGRGATHDEAWQALQQSRRQYLTDCFKRGVPVQPEPD